MNLTEAQTRIQLIDKRLALAGWNVKDHAQVIEELEIHLRADRTEYPKTSYGEGDSRFSDYCVPLSLVQHSEQPGRLGGSQSGPPGMGHQVADRSPEAKQPHGFICNSSFY